MKHPSSAPKFPILLVRCLAVLALLLASCLPGLCLSLVKDGQPDAILVVPDDDVFVPRFAAKEFQHHVKRSTGAELPILTETEAEGRPGARVYFGATKALKAAGLGGEDFGKYGYAGRLRDGSLYFYGRDSDFPVPKDIPEKDWLVQSARPLCWEKPVGTLLATYDFLESQLGARWIWPGPTGEYVDVRKDVTVEAYDKAGKPRYLSNHMMPFEEDALEQRQWLLRQRFLRLDPALFINDHAFVTYWNEYKDSHPEIFAMWPGGKRTPVDGQPGDLMAMCVSNPDLARIKVERWKNGTPSMDNGQNVRSDGDFQKGFINVGENDVAGYCVCEACRKMDAPDPRFATHPYWAKGELKPFNEGGRWLRDGKGSRDAYSKLPSLTDRYMKFYLAVQKEAEKYNPGVLIRGQAYANYDEPPKETKLNDRIVISFVKFPGITWTPEDTRDTLASWDAWQEAGATLFLRPNITNFRGHNMPDFYARQLGDTLKHIANTRLIGTNWDALLGQWAVHAPNFYMIGRMLQEPDRTSDEILQEFYGAFGPAKNEVAAYFQLCDKASNTLSQADWDAFVNDTSEMGASSKSSMHYLAQSFTPEVMAQARELLDKALAAAKGDQDAEQKVRILDLGFQESNLTMNAFRAFQKITRKDPASQKNFVAAVDALQAFRKAHRGEYVNYGLEIIEQRENQLWGDVLKQIRAKFPQQQAADQGSAANG
ncbi:MAG TPA: DUF4838 domain-containing protein [Terrimicrobiaceae bacterium]|nr:DUF4838 domain-containing protein [Terrimicrobiaceae bacterium]